MEDDNGLELSLGLRCGGPSAKSNGKVGSSADGKIDEGDKGKKVVDDFGNYFQAGAGSQKNDCAIPQENFFNNLINRGEVEEEDKRSETSNKRKISFDEMNQSKKLEKESNHGVYEQARASHISNTTDEGSTAKNEDVADSEVDGSTSRLVTSQPSEIPNEFKRRHFYGVSQAVQSMNNTMHVPFSLPVKDSSSIGATSYPSTGMQHVTPLVNDEHSVKAGNSPVTFGYNRPVQLPVSENNNFFGMAPQSQQFHPAFLSRGAGGGPPNSGMLNDRLKLAQVPNLSESLLYGERGPESARGDNKSQAKEEGSTYQKDENMKRNTINARTNDPFDGSRAKVVPHEGPSIRPGATADLKFGGSGSMPNLPWVSTTAPGPYGRTISGVSYRFSGNQIKIVCACHGSHLSPEEFVRHASEDHPKPDNGNSLASLPNGNPASSAQT